MNRALIFCQDELMARLLQRTLRSLEIEPVSLQEPLPPEGDPLYEGCVAGIFEQQHPRCAAVAAQLVLRLPDLRRVFLCGDQEPPPLHENEVALGGAFSLAEIRAALLPALEGGPSSSAPLIFDPDQLFDCARGEPEEIRRMYALFLSGAEGQLARLQAALDEGNEEEARQAYHRLCGAAATAGAEDLAARCRKAMLQLDAGQPGPDAAALRASMAQFQRAYGAWMRHRFLG